MKADDVLDFIRNLYDKEIEEIQDFVAEFEKEYANMSLEDKELLDKNRDMLEGLMFYSRR